jgi:hypothetical protein
MMKKWHWRRDNAATTVEKKTSDHYEETPAAVGQRRRLCQVLLLHPSRALPARAQQSGGVVVVAEPVR